VRGRKRTATSFPQPEPETNAQAEQLDQGGSAVSSNKEGAGDTLPAERASGDASGVSADSLCEAWIWDDLRKKAPSVPAGAAPLSSQLLPVPVPR
jgi:hypothetical protein